MKKLFYIALTILSSNVCHSQWQMLNTPTSENLNDIFFLNKDTGYAVSSWGLILTTHSSGNSWDTLRLTVPGDYLIGVWFVNALTGFVILNIKFGKQLMGVTIIMFIICLVLLNGLMKSNL